jgi:hypothetical protein
MQEWAQGELVAGRVTIAEIHRERSPEPAYPVPTRSGHQASRARCPKGHSAADYCLTLVGFRMKA